MSTAGGARAIDAPCDETRVAPCAPALVPPAAPAGPRAWSQRLAHSLAWNAAAEFAARGASLWLALACARALPVAAFGRFSFALALAQYAWLAGDTLANAGYATREVARIRRDDGPSARRLKGRILGLRLAAAAVITAVMGAVLLLVPMPGDLRGALAGASVFFLAYAAFPDWALRAREDFRTLAFANLAAGAALIAGTLVLLPLRPTAGVAAALWSFSFLVAAAVSLAHLLPRGAFDWTGDREPLAVHARRSSVFALGAMGGIGIAQAPMLIVGLLATPLQGGLFGASYRFLLIVINGFAVFWWPLMPVLVRSRPGERDFREALAAMWGVVLVLGLPAMLAFTMWPSELLSLAFGERYAAGAATLRLTGFVVPLVATTALLEQACLALGGEGLRARINLAAMALLVLAGIVLVPARGPEGAALALLAAYGSSLAAYAIAYRHALPWSALLASARLPLVASTALALAWAGAQAAHVPGPLALAGGCGAYAAAVLASRMWQRRAARPAAGVS